MKTLRRMLCLVDGEHYFPVTKSALDMLDSLEHNEVVAVVFIGGTEKDVYKRQIILQRYSLRKHLFL